MANLNGFNANEVEPTSAYEPLPAGKYVASITASEMKPTKRADGSYLELEFTVLEGQYAGRKIWDRLCLNHPNALTQQIARGNLSAICRAVGILQPSDSAELHNAPMEITVKCVRREDTGEVSNDVKGYKACGQTAQQVNQSSSVNDNTPPWQR